MKSDLLLTNILLETFINVHDKSKMVPFIDDVWNILQKSYEPIGGFLSASSKEDLINKTGLMKLVRKNGKIVAVKIYKDELGRKSIAAGTDGSNEGVKWVIKMFQDDIKFDRAWGEFSDKAEHLMLKHGGVPIPNQLASQILGKDILKLNSDGFHYTRMIMGEPHEKILIGNVEKLTKKVASRV